MTAEELIRTHQLVPHPEGGWYRETWRAKAGPGERAAASAVFYVMQPGEESHWNRVDADEIWLWHGGDPIDVSIGEGDDGPVRTLRLDGTQPQVIVPRASWQAAVPVAGESGFAFISCVATPAFEFSGFELAEAGWSPGA